MSKREKGEKITSKQAYKSSSTPIHKIDPWEIFTNNNEDLIKNMPTKHKIHPKREYDITTKYETRGGSRIRKSRRKRQTAKKNYNKKKTNLKHRRVKKDDGRDSSSPNIPNDLKLYNKTKKNVYNKYPKHSAYRSGILVQTYKKNFQKKYGNNKSPYSGQKTQKKGLSRWFKEEWKNQRGSVGYKYKSDVYRPTRKITNKTPITFKELNKKQVKKAREEKYNKGRVYRF